MRFFFILYCLTAHLLVSAQGQVDIPITKNEVMQFRTFSAAMQLPAAYKVEKGTVSVVSQKDHHSNRHTINSDLMPDVKYWFSKLETGDKVVFDDIVVVKGDKKIKLAIKSYVIK